MPLRKARTLIGIAITVLLIIGCTATVFAAPNVQWHTDGVYYDGSGRLVISGFFRNEGTVTIDKINWIVVNVQLQANDGTWWFAYSFNWSNINVVLRPGEIHRCNLRSGNPVQQHHFQNSRIFGTINYHIRPEIPTT